jgi:hypothetical protein
MVNTFKFLFLLLFVFGVTLSSPAQDEALKIKKLSKNSEVIISGKVIHKASSWNKSKSRIYTRTTVQVDEYLKGSHSESSVDIISPGGEVGDVGEIYSHMPRFEDNEEVLVFLKKDTKDKEYKVLNGEEGKIRVVTDKESKQKVTGSNIPLNDLKVKIKKYISE